MSDELQTVRCWRLEEWPERDRIAWTEGCAPGDPFDDPRPGSSLREASLKKIAKGYGRWLDYLASHGWLDPDLPPEQRVTPARIAGYAQELLMRGNADYTVIGRIAELAMALSVMAPGHDFLWVRKPYGTTIYSLLPKRRRPKPAPDIDVLYAWAIEIMDKAKAGNAALKSVLIDYRDGLLLAVFAARARRLRSMALLRLGHEIFAEEGWYRIELAPHQVKTDRRDAFNLPDDLTPYIEHYVQMIRTKLLGGRPSTAFWIGRGGEQLSEKGIQTTVMRRTFRRFGITFGPHRFRHALATTVALYAEEFAGSGAAVLAISPAVAEGHYVLAGQSAGLAKLCRLVEGKQRALRQSA